MSKTLDGTGRLLGLTVDPNDTNVNKLIVSSTTSSGSSTTGALTVAGGVGIAGNLNVGGSITGGSISYASTTTGTLAVTNTTDSTSTTTGVLTVAGGVGIAKQVFVGSNTDVTGRLSVGYAASKEALLNLGKSGTYGSRSAYIYQSATGNMEINNQENGDFLLSTNNGGKMIIKPDGKVGIATSSPTDLFHVKQNSLSDTVRIEPYTYFNNGLISSTSIQIQSGTAPNDYSNITYGSVNFTNNNFYDPTNDKFLTFGWYGLDKTQAFVKYYSSVGQTVTINGCNRTKYITTPGTYTLTNYDGFVIVNASGGTVTCKLASAVGSFMEIGTIYKFINQSGTTTIKNYSNTSQFAQLTQSSSTISLINIDKSTNDGVWVAIDTYVPLLNTIGGSSTTTSVAASVAYNNNSSGTSASVPLMAMNSYANSSGSETAFVVGRSLSNNDSAQLSFINNGSASTNEIRIHQWGDLYSGIHLKNGQAKIGSGSYFSYSETSYSPAVTASDNSGTTSYTVRQGYYSQTGKTVTFSFQVDGSITGANAGKDFRVSLPFTANYAGQFPCYSITVNGASFYYRGGAYLAGGTAYLTFWDNQNNLPIQTSAAVDTFKFYGTITYITT